MTDTLTTIKEKLTEYIYPDEYPIQDMMEFLEDHKLATVSPQLNTELMVLLKTLQRIDREYHLMMDQVDTVLAQIEADQNVGKSPLVYRDKDGNIQDNPVATRSNL